MRTCVRHPKINGKNIGKQQANNEIENIGLYRHKTSNGTLVLQQLLLLLLFLLKPLEGKDKSQRSYIYFITKNAYVV